MRHPLRLPSTLLLALSLASAGCEVSVFGSSPIQLVGGATPSGGGEHGACGEPEDGRRVRERLLAGAPTSGEASPCVYHCVFEAGALTDESRADCPLVAAEGEHVLRLDMSRADAFVARMELCPDGVLQLGDSRGGRADGSDDPTTSHDASVLVAGETLELFPAHGGGLAPSRVEGYLGGGAEGDACTTRTWVVADSVVYLADLERGLCGASMLRIDPPTDDQGRPDSSFFLALGQSLDGTRAGTPPPRVELCFF